MKRRALIAGAVMAAALAGCGSSGISTSRVEQDIKDQKSIGLYSNQPASVSCTQASDDSHFTCTVTGGYLDGPGRYNVTDDPSSRDFSFVRVNSSGGANYGSTDPASRRALADRRRELPNKEGRRL